MIESYSHGVMIIGGKTYVKDVVILPGGAVSSWWRTEGHFLGTADLAAIIKAKPAYLIIGKGSSGFMKVPLITRLALKEENIEIIDRKTEKAVQIFNEQVGLGRRVAGAFHLTC